MPFKFLDILKNGLMNTDIKQIKWILICMYITSILNKKKKLNMIETFAIQIIDITILIFIITNFN